MLTTTKSADAQYLKVLVYGPAGAGKTRLAATVSKPLIISAEAGLLSLREFDLPVYAVKSMVDMEGAYQEASTGDYDWIVLDSISELSEVCLTEEKKKTDHGMRAYGEMGDIILSLLRAFRDLPRHVYFSAKQAKNKDEMTGAMLYGPSMEGNKLTTNVPYLFDEVFALHTYKNDEGVIERSFQTERDNQYDAKDRSGALDFWEPADLGKIQTKILNEKDIK